MSINRNQLLRLQDYNVDTVKLIVLYKSCACQKVVNYLGYFSGGPQKRKPKKVKCLYILFYFHRHGPLGRFSHRVAMSVCLCVCLSVRSIAKHPPLAPSGPSGPTTQVPLFELAAWEKLVTEEYLWRQICHKQWNTTRYWRHKRPCKIQCIFDCHRVVETISPLFLYMREPHPLAQKKRIGHSFPMMQGDCFACRFVLLGCFSP